MRNRDAWLAAIAATLGISEEACRRDAAPAHTDVATATASASMSATVAETAPSASAEIAPLATASAAPSASASVASSAKPAPSEVTLHDLQAICGARPPNLNQIPNGICGASNIPNTNNMNLSCGATVGRPGLGNGSCGGSASTNTVPVRGPQAQVALNVTGGASGDDRVAMGLRPRFRACANQALNIDPSQQGRLVVVAKIAANGEVTQADVASNTGLSAASAQCMARGVRNAQFPAGAARTIQLAITQTKQSP